MIQDGKQIRCEYVNMFSFLWFRLLLIFIYPWSLSNQAARRNVEKHYDYTYIIGFGGTK